MAVTSEQNVFVASWLGFFLAEFIGTGLELVENRLQSAWRRPGLCDIPVFIFM